jgi:hypothetical protein
VWDKSERQRTLENIKEYSQRVERVLHSAANVGIGTAKVQSDL